MVKVSSSTNAKPNPYRNLFRDIFFVLLSIFLSGWVVRLGLIDGVVNIVSEIKLLATFVAGFFFTSAFTLAPAAVVLATLAKEVSPLVLAFWGALGALCGDLTIYLFVSDRFAKDIMDVLKITRARKVLHILHKGYFRWLSPLLGAIIIAGPFPDEIGLTLMGMSKTRLAFIIPISFAVNFVAIWAIAHVAGGF